MRACVGCVVGWVMVAALNCGWADAEDFSVHLEQMAEIDGARAIPEYKIEKELRLSRMGPFDLPVKAYKVLIHFKEFGDVELGEAETAGPSTGKQWPAGTTFDSGVDATSVKTGWIKDAGDLFIVAWVDESSPLGNHLHSDHDCAIMRLKGGRAEVLLRRDCNGSSWHASWSYDLAMVSTRFSFDRRRGILIEEMTRSADMDRVGPGPLAHLQPGKEGGEDWVAEIREKVRIEYKLTGSGLKPVACSLTYVTQNHDEISKIAEFYLGPLASGQLLLDANADLAAKHKDYRPGYVIDFPAGVQVRIPVPQEWLIERYCPRLKGQHPQ